MERGGVTCKELGEEGGQNAGAFVEITQCWAGHPWVGGWGSEGAWRGVGGGGCGW